MQCNIDKRGRVVRLIGGLLCMALGVALGIATYAAAWSPWLYLLAGVLLLGGAFAVYEARKKWCALRAMGIRTPV